jgi:hypothetical protein
VCAFAAVAENNTRPSSAGATRIAFEVFIARPFVWPAAWRKATTRQAGSRVNARKCTRIPPACTRRRCACPV